MEALRVLGQCSREAVREGIAQGPADAVSIEPTTLPDGRVLAVVSTPCHEAAGGAYNYEYSVVLVDGTAVTAAPFEEHPDVAGAVGLEERSGPCADWMTCTVTGALLSDENGTVVLTSVMLMRGIGDSGWVERYAWQDSKFVRVEFRSRDGGSAFVREPGPFPIIEPASRRCRPILTIDEGPPAVVVLTSLAGPDSQRDAFPVHDTNCSNPDGGDTLDCEGSSYTVVSDGNDWVVHHVADDNEQSVDEEVFRRPRGCRL